MTVSSSVSMKREVPAARVSTYLKALEKTLGIRSKRAIINHFAKMMKRVVPVLSWPLPLPYFKAKLD